MKIILNIESPEELSKDPVTKANQVDSLLLGIARSIVEENLATTTIPYTGASNQNFVAHGYLEVQE